MSTRSVSSTARTAAIAPGHHVPSPSPSPSPPPPPPPLLPLSVAIACKDNAATIGRTLESVAGLAGEIVAADSGSKDATLALLTASGARIIHTPWLGYCATKRLAVEACAMPWVLLLDSDESVEPGLASAIRTLIGRADPAVVGARVNRRVWYRGSPLRHAFQPEWRVRLARRDRMAIGGYDPHDRVDVRTGPGERVVDLGGTGVGTDLRHDSFPSFAVHFERQARHARDAAQSLYAAGKRSSVTRLITAGPIEFLKQAVVKGAWRDGAPGWLAAASMAAYAAMKHGVLIELGLRGQPTASTANPPATSPAARGAPDQPHTASTARPAYAYHQSDAAVEGNKPAAAPSLSLSSSNDREAKLTESNDLGQLAHDAVVSFHQLDDHQPHSSSPGDSGGSSDGYGGNAAHGSPTRKKRRRRRGKKPVGVESHGREDHDDASPDDEPRRKRGLTAVKPISDEAREQVFDTARGFADLGLRPELVGVLDEAGWRSPTKIQSELIPLALTGRDILGQAKTGSGKTAAFGLPVLHMAERGRPFQALILAPTRELALQIRDDLEALGARTGLRVCPVYGGQKIHTQARRLEAGPEIVVGTPGRVMDMNARGLLPLDRVRFAILDEVDRMFDIGFRDDIRKILALCNTDRQTVFVSATISAEIERLVRKHMNDPARLVVAAGSLTVEMVRQHYIPVQPWDKKRMMVHVLTHEEPDLTIVFCRMKRTVDDVVRFLGEKGIEAHALHGDLSQGQRNRVMKNFRHGELNVLVASDLAARGLDVEGITHVINYDLPEDPDLYVHRIGRTARAGRDGVAWSLVTPEQGPLLTQIENLINAEIPKREYPDFETRDTPPQGFRPESKPGQYVVTGVPAPKPKNRFEAKAPPPPEKLTDAEIAAKFPGGVVPKKLPRKRLGGKVRTTRGNQD